MRSINLSWNIILVVIAVFALTGVAIATGSGWTADQATNTSTSIKTATVDDCSDPVNGIFCEDFESGNLLGWSSHTIAPCQVPTQTLPVPTVTP